MATIKALMEASMLRLGSRGGMPNDDSAITLYQDELTKVETTEDEVDKLKYVAPTDGYLTGRIWSTSNESGVTVRDNTQVVTVEGKHAVAVIPAKKGRYLAFDLHKIAGSSVHSQLKFFKTIGGGAKSPCNQLFRRRKELCLRLNNLLMKPLSPSLTRLTAAPKVSSRSLQQSQKMRRSLITRMSSPLMGPSNAASTKCLQTPQRITLQVGRSVSGQGSRTAHTWGTQGTPRTLAAIATRAKPFTSILHEGFGSALRSFIPEPLGLRQVNLQTTSASSSCSFCGGM